MGQWRRRLFQQHAPSDLLPLTHHPLNGTIRFPAPQEINLSLRSEPQWSITCPVTGSINQEQSLQHVGVLRDSSYPNHAIPGWVPAFLLGSVTSGKLFSLSKWFLTCDTLDFLILLARTMVFTSDLFSLTQVLLLLTIHLQFSFEKKRKDSQTFRFYDDAAKAYWLLNTWWPCGIGSSSS